MQIINKIKNRSSTKKHCPICKKNSLEFKPYGNPPRKNALCPHCNSAERHRMVYYFLKKSDIFNKKIKLLHFAPENIFYEIFSNCKNIDYYPVDISKSRKIKERVDIQNIPYEDDYFDVIYNSHVLEHVPDDIKAMKELYRVVKPKNKGGIVITLVPISCNIGETLEKEEYNTPKLRLKYYGQADHLRRYGADFTDKLKSVGFNIDVIKNYDLFKKKEIDKYCINKGNIIFLSYK